MNSRPLRALDAAPPVARISNIRWLGLAIAIALGLLVMFSPPPAGLTVTGLRVLAVTTFTVCLWAFQVLDNGIAAILMMAMLIVAGVAPSEALSGFSDGSWWILTAVMFYGCAMKKTGLAERISYYILSLFPVSYAGILSAFFMVGLVLALGVPSITVRTAIMVPIAWAAVQSLGLQPRSKGSALIILTTVEMAVIPGGGLLLSSLNGPVIQSAFEAKNLPLTYREYAAVMALPSLVICVLIVIANLIVLKPESPLNVSSGFATKELHALGGMKQSEMITALVIVASLAMWATDAFHHLPSFVIGMIGLAVLGLAGIITETDMGTGVSWTLLLFIGGVFSLANVIQSVKITDWLGEYFAPFALQLSSNTFLLIGAMTVTVFILRFIDPVGFIVIPVLFLTLVDVLMKAGISPIVVAAPSMAASAPFFLPYQNFWIAMSERLTGGKAYDGKQRLIAAATYAVVVLTVLVLSVIYWKLIGAIGQ